MTPRRTLPLGLAAAAVAGAVLPAAALADSIAYVRDHNVWIANPDGSGQYQVTLDGTASSPYRSPSQADDGTIAVSHGEEILRLRQNGTVIGRFDPPALTNSVSHPVDGVPVQVAISPDGARIAWTFATFSCPIGASCGARTATGITTADGTGSLGTNYFRNPSWAGNGRILAFGGFLSQVNVQDVGGAAVHWYDDRDLNGDGSTDLGDGELSRDGSRFAAIRGYGTSTHVIWYRVTGDALAGPPPGPPEPLCQTGTLEGLAGPTWAPDLSGIAWQEPDGVWVKGAPDDCTVQPRLVIPGGSEPDWGPAAVNPGPRGGTAGPGPVTPGTQTPGTVTPPALSVAASRARIGVVRRAGLRVRVTAGAPGVVRVTARLGRRVVGVRTVRVARPGVLAVAVTPSAAGRRLLARRTAATLGVTVTFTARGRTVTRAVTVRVTR